MAIKDSHLGSGASYHSNSGYNNSNKHRWLAKTVTMATGLIQEAANLPSVNPKYKYGFMSRTASRDSTDGATSDSSEVLRRSRSFADTVGVDGKGGVKVGGASGGAGPGGRKLQRSDPALSRHVLHKSSSAHGKLLLRTFFSTFLFFICWSVHLTRYTAWNTVFSLAMDKLFC